MNADNYNNENIEIVTWPESQGLSSFGDDWEDHCELITDKDSIKKFGVSAYAVDKSWYNKVTSSAQFKDTHTFTKKDIEHILNLASQWDEGMRDYGLMDPADYVMKYI